LALCPNISKFSSQSLLLVCYLIDIVMVIRNIKTAQILLLPLHKQTEEVRCLSTAEESTGEYPMSIGKKGDIALEEVSSAAFLICGLKSAIHVSQGA